MLTPIRTVQYALYLMPFILCSTTGTVIEEGILFNPLPMKLFGRPH